MSTSFLRVASFLLFGLCFAWVVLVHASFLLTPDDEDTWIASLRATNAAPLVVALLVFQCFFLALVFCLTALRLRVWVHSAPGFGFLAGLLFALWVNTQFLLLVDWNTDAGLTQVAPVLLANFVLWPLLGWSLGWVPFLKEWSIHKSASSRRGAAG